MALRNILELLQLFFPPIQERKKLLHSCKESIFGTLELGFKFPVGLLKLSIPFSSLWEAPTVLRKNTSEARPNLELDSMARCWSQACEPLWHRGPPNTELGWSNGKIHIQKFLLFFLLCEVLGRILHQVHGRKPAFHSSLLLCTTFKN